MPTMVEQAMHLKEVNRNLPLLYGLSFLLSPFISGLAPGAAAYAYRALTNGTDHA